MVRPHPELDKIKTTITVSMGLKNLLRRLKGGWSHEEYIRHLILHSGVNEKLKNNIRDDCGTVLAGKK